MLRDLPIDRLHLRADARMIDADAVQAMAESIASLGLLHPIRVRENRDGWEVIAGAHRVEAHKVLGLVEIACNIVTDDDLHSELAMIDENLCRSNLGAVDRARQMARRKAIYEELHPETRQGPYRRYLDPEIVDAKVPSFVDSTAAATGSSSALVSREARRGNNVLPEALELIAGTELDKGAYLDQLASLPGSEQMTAVERDLAQIRRGERVHATAVEGELKSLMSAWKKSSKEARAKFLERVRAN